MERRLLTFIVASTAFFLVYMSLQVMFAPPPKPPVELPEPADGLVVEEDLPGQDAPAAADIPVDKDAPSGGEDVVQADPQDAALQRPQDPQWITLGSMDPASNYYMLVTLNTRGAGVERIELTERQPNGKLKYRRVDVRHGYLGYLAAQPAAEIDGIQVNVVGPGTPAELAGLQVGDVITAVGGAPVTSRDVLDAILLKTEPGDSVDLSVLRSAAPLELTATLTNHPLDMVRLAEGAGADQVPGNLSRLSCLMTLSQVNRKSIGIGGQPTPGFPGLDDVVWNAERVDAEAAQVAAFEVELSAAEMGAVGGQPVRVKRSYALLPAEYSMDLALQVDNLADEPQDLGFRLEGPNGITLEGWWYSTKISPNFSGAAARDVVFNTVAEGHELVSGFELLKLAKKTPENPTRPIFAPDMDEEAQRLKYIGVDAQYFAAAYLPPPGQPTFGSFRRAVAGVASDPLVIPSDQERAVNSTFFLDSEIATVPAGGSLRQELQMFAGPKAPEVLDGYGLGELIYYGWFSGFARLLAGLLHLLAGVGNYALAIILLTVIVRGAMFPLSRKAAINAQKMQELAPELKKITEKYKDDLEGRMKAQRELQKRVGFNPMAGCLPMFLQLPIFIGLYRALSVDIELRQQPVISGMDWASNLAGPDMLAYWGDWLWEYLSGRGTGWLGPYFNLLPVVVVGLFLVQQKLFMPPATDEQTAMTQKMMNIMTLMMGLFFFRVPAGLCIYFITSSLWGIGERILVKKTLPQGAHFDAAVLEGTAVDRQEKPKTETLSERIRNRVSTPEPVFDRPHKRKRPKRK